MNKKIKKIVSIMVLGAFSALALAGCGNGAGEDEVSDAGDEKIVIQLNSSQSEGSVAYECALLLKDKVESEIGTDRIEIQFFPDGQLGSDDEILDGMAVGTHDAIIVGTPVTAVDSSFGIFDMPFLMTNEEEVKTIINGPVGEMLTESIAEKGYVNAGFWFSGWRQITNNVRPIVTPSDLEGLKIRVPSSRSREMLFDLLGANPTPLSFGDLFSGLQQNLVDGQENPLYVLTANSLKDVQKYLSISNHVVTIYSILFSQEKWDTYPEDVQDAIMNAVAEISDESFEISDRIDAEALEAVKDTMEINDVDMEAFKAATAPIYEDAEFVEEIGQDVIDAALESLGRK